MRNENFCVSCGEFYEIDMMETTCNGKQVCRLCKETYEQKIKKIHSIDELKRMKYIEEFVKKGLLSPTELNHEKICDEMASWSFKEYLYGLSLVPIDTKKPSYGLWVKQVVEDHIEKKVSNQDLKNAIQVITFLLCPDEEFNEAFSEKDFWKNLYKNDFLKRKFIMAIRTTVGVQTYFYLLFE